MNQSESVQNSTKNKLSVCDIMKKNTSKIINKLESNIPERVQQYSDLYTAYFHNLDDLFGSCYISEKKFFDKLNIDQEILKEMEQFSNSFATLSLEQIDFFSKYFDAYIQMRISALKTGDNFMHVMMDYYEKSLSWFNKYADSYINTKSDST